MSDIISEEFGQNMSSSDSTNNAPSNAAMNHFVVGKNKPIEVRYTDEQMQRAKERAEELGELRNSITRGKSNVWGMLGEEVIRDYLNCTDSDDIYNYDLLTPNGHKLEIKTKKTTMTVPPKGHFECSVCNHNPNQNCDIYVFVRASTRSKKVWICGMKDKTSFAQQARYFKKGDTDPSNGYRVHASCWNMNISELDSIDNLKTPAAEPAAETEQNTHASVETEQNTI